MRRVCNVIISHQTREVIDQLLKWWSNFVTLESLLIAYGGTPEDFETISFQQKIFVSDNRLRTGDHQREFQSYTGLFQEVSSWIREDMSYDFVHFAEYDHLPLIKDLNRWQIEKIDSERADVLGCHLHRVDGTSYPHYLYHSSNSLFHPWFAKLSKRPDPAVILSMLGTGSFWRREALEAVAQWEEPFPVYMEIYLPTLAHHLGYRIRGWGDQERFVFSRGNQQKLISEAQAAGAWTIHPVKKVPSLDIAAR